MSAALVRAVARALADGRRVLLAGDDFEALQLLASADVRELVLVSALADPDAPAGTTGGGAPLRMRNDWRERPSSKDLVVDLTGEAPADEVARVLKKAGVYVSAEPNAASAALAHQVTFETSVADALVGGEGVGVGVVLGRDDAPGPSVVLAGKTPPEIPAVVCALPAGELDRPSPDAGEIERLTREVAEHTDAAARSAKAALEAQAATTTLEADYAAVRDELAERRVNDQRVERVRERFEAARAEMASEIEGLRARLLAVDEPATDLEAVTARVAELQAGYRRLGAELRNMVKRLGWPSVPAPPADAASLEGWLDTVQAAADAGVREQKATKARLADAERAQRATAKRVRELTAAKAAPATPPAAPEPTVASDAELGGRIESLEAALRTERALRDAERVTHERLEAAARAAQSGRDALLADAAAARQEAAKARLAEAAAVDESRRLRAEIALREAYAGEVEAMLKTHTSMQKLLTESLLAANSARDESDAQRRLSDENLRILREEFERDRVD